MDSTPPGIDQQFRAANKLLLRVLRDESSDHDLVSDLAPSKGATNAV
jgi:hypothetical protein